jgi:hypothetical protein
LRDNFNITTWLLLGAAAQSFLHVLLPFRYAICPVAVFLSWGGLLTLLTFLKLSENQQMSDVVLGKFSAQIPDIQGVFPDNAAGHEVVLILLSARSNQYV